ncbi:MAG: tRNA dihydrouridine synthase [Nanoarchaeota archaeon]
MNSKNINLKKQIKKNPFILAPMDNVTDIGFRQLCEKHHASYTCSELTSVEALIREKVPKYRYQRGNLKINCVQLFGSNYKNFSKALDIIDDQTDIIDVNFGCPSTTLHKNNSGAILLKDPQNVSKIIQNLVDHTNKPVTAKIRLGYNKTNYLEVAKQIEDAGANLITLHARTAKQRYSGKANWDAIKKLYKTSNIPIVGNGDIKDENDIDKYLNKYSDALMLGRSAIGNPIIFKRFYNYYKTGQKLKIKDIKENQKKLFIQYLKEIENKQFYKKDIKIASQAMWFMKGIKGAKELRINIMQIKDSQKIINQIHNF